MTDAEAQPPPNQPGVHLVLYDGVCGLCNRLVQFLLRHDHHQVFRFASLQSATGQSLVERSGGDPQDLTSFYVVADFEKGAPRVFTKSDAAMFVAGELDWPWKAARVVRFVPKSIRDRGYDFVARSRYRVFGRYDHCLIPSREFRSRFID